MPIPIILDCDPGHDDAIAILLALASPELRVEAITTVAGNSTLANTTANARRVLDLVGADHIPVAAGADAPLRRKLVTAAHVHGAGGLDGPRLAPPSRPPEPVGAVDLISRILREAADPVTLVAVGPLTNIAMLLASHPELNDRIERLVLMGGSIGLGNITPAAEFNIYVDPEAAATVFGSGLDITMIGLDVTHNTTLGEEHGDILRASGPVGGFVAELLDFFMIHYRRVLGRPAAAIHDAAAVAHLAIPGLVETRAFNVEVETGSDLTRGRTVVDVMGVTGRPVNASVGIHADSQLFSRVLVERLLSLDH